MLIPDTLAARARAHPDRRALVFLDDHGDEAAALTYAELHARALAVAHAVRASCRPGERALLVFPPGLDFVVAFLGCLSAGVVAVPISPPAPGASPTAAGAVLADCAPSAVLTVEALAPLRAHLGDLPWLAVDRLADPGSSPDPLPPPTADATALLQYTSGSTSAPKGVMVTHGNLAANQEMIRRAFGHDEHATFVGWTPLFHDQGLIGNVLQPLHVGTTSVLMSPVTFMRRPLLWATTVSRYRAHTSGGPDFAFAACARAAAASGGLDDLDLSCWRVAFDGAEPIRPDTLRRFAETFAPCGFDPRALFPCYGLAEATLLVSGSGKGRGPRTLEADPAALEDGILRPGTPGRPLAGSGTPVEGSAVEIVDPDGGGPCAPGRIGEIEVRGDHVAAGYWRRPDDGAATFVGPGVLRTGDLGAIVDGELYVVGRRTDLIVVRGRNIHPQDVEQTVVAAHPALRPGACAAFGLATAHGEALAAVVEVRRDPHPRPDPDALDAAVRAAVLREHRLALAGLAVVPAGTLAKTTSGKIRRAAARERYQDRGFTSWRAGAADQQEVG